jgi:hypothetical protein
MRLLVFPPAPSRHALSLYASESEGRQTQLGSLYFIASSPSEKRAAVLTSEGKKLRISVQIFGFLIDKCVMGIPNGVETENSENRWTLRVSFPAPSEYVFCLAAPGLPYAIASLPFDSNGGSSP